MGVGRGTFALLGIFLGATLAAAWPIYQMQGTLDELRSGITAEESIRYLPSGQFLSSAVLGYDNLAADLLWVRGIALFGERYKDSEDLGWYDWLFQLIDLATDLDPIDVRIYKYGGLMLRLEPTRTDQSIYVFHKGMQHCPDEYFLPFGISMNYLERKDAPEKAAEYMRQAATRPNAPFYLRSLAASLLDKNRKQDVALAFLEEEQKQLQPGSLPYRAVEVKIIEVKHNRIVEELRAALGEFLSKYNRIPSPLREMEGKTWRKPWPVDPYGGQFILDPKIEDIRSSIYERARRRFRHQLGLGSEKKENDEAITGPTLN